MGKTGAVVLALVVGVVIGYYIGTRPKGGGGVEITPQEKCRTPQNQFIGVSLQGTPVCSDVAVSKSADDKIQWETTPGASLWISFPSGGFGATNSGGTNTQQFSVPRTYTVTGTPTPIDYRINVFGIGTPTPPQGVTPTPQANGRIIIMK